MVEQAMGRLSDKNVVVTGGATGMGLQMAQLFGSEGARVVIIDLVRAQLDESLQRLCDAGIRAHAHQADVTHAEAMATTFNEIADRFDGAIRFGQQRRCR